MAMTGVPHPSVPASPTYKGSCTDDVKEKQVPRGARDDKREEGGELEGRERGQGGEEGDVKSPLQKKERTGR